jgi:hypothetical protein
VITTGSMPPCAQQLQPVAVQRGEGLDRLAVLADVDAPVSEHAVHVEEGDLHAEFRPCARSSSGAGKFSPAGHAQMTFARMRSLLLSAPTMQPCASTTMTLVIAVALHELGRVHRQRVGAHQARRGVHHLACAQREQVRPALDEAAQVAVGEDAQRQARVVAHRREAQAARAHLAQHLRQRRIGPDHGHVRAAAHEVAHVHEQLAPEAAAGVRTREVLLHEAARIQQRHCQRVAQRHLRRGARRGARFSGQASWSTALDSTMSACCASVDCSRPVIATSVTPMAPQRRQDRRELVDLAGVADGQHHIAGRDHAQVAVAGLGRVHEERGRAGGGQRGGDLAADVSALAHAHDDGATAAREHGLHRARETLALARGQRLQRTRLDARRCARPARARARARSAAAAAAGLGSGSGVRDKGLGRRGGLV